MVNKKIEKLLLEFNEITTRQERIVFEQQLSFLLLELNATEKDYLFEKMLSATAENFKAIGAQLDENQLNHIENAISLRALSLN